jgi:hypothetical protein
MAAVEALDDHRSRDERSGVAGFRAAALRIFGYVTQF